MRKRLLWGGLVATCAVALAACGGSGSQGAGSGASTTQGPRPQGTGTTLVPAPSANPAPGHGSPGAALVGFTQGLATADTAEACSYVALEIQSSCLKSSPPTTTGAIGVGNTVISGDEALVALLATHYCVGTECYSNTDRDNGLPLGSTTFAQAFATAVGSNDQTHVVACVREDGKWYVAG